MTLRTGNKSGFTLIEVMVATAVLAGGVVLIFEALFSTTNTFSYYSNRMAVGPWIDQKIWEVSEAVLTGVPVDMEGSLAQGNRQYSWRVSQSFNSESRLAKIGVEVSWRQGKREVRMQRGTYVFVPPEEKGSGEG